MTIMRSSGIISIIFLLLLCAWSCGPKQPKVIPEGKMVDLLVDMELAEAYANVQGGQTSDQKVEMGRRVLEAHGVSEEELDTTLAWYGRNMDKYSGLFEKVDKEIEKRHKKYTEIPGQEIRESDNLWPYNPHLILTPQSGYESFSFYLGDVDVNKGDLVNLNMYLPNVVGLKGTFGVEYKDGSGEASVSNFSTKHKIEMMLQTDTAKEVSKLYGVFTLKDTPLPTIYIDSISIKTEPLDSASYRSKKRTQKLYGIMMPPPKPEPKESPVDTIKNDSIEIKEIPQTGPGTEGKKPELSNKNNKGSLKKRENESGLRN